MKLSAYVVVVGAAAVAACGRGASGAGQSPPPRAPPVLAPVASVAAPPSPAASTPPARALPKPRVVVEGTRVDAAAGIGVDQDHVVWITYTKARTLADDARALHGDDDPDADLQKLMRAPLAGGGKPEELATFSAGARGLQIASDAYYVHTPGLLVDCKKKCGIVRIDRKDPKKVTTVVKGEDVGAFTVANDQVYWLSAPPKAPPFSNKTLHSTARNGGGSTKVVTKIDVEKSGVVFSGLEPLGDKLGWVGTGKKSFAWNVVPVTGGPVQTVLDLGEIGPMPVYAVNASGVIVARHQDDPSGAVLSRVPFVGTEKELGKLDAGSRVVQIEQDDTGALFVIVEDATKRDHYRILHIAPDGTHVIAEHQGDAPFLTLASTAIVWTASRDGSGAILAVDKKR